MKSLLFATIFLAQATEPVGVPAWVPIVIGVIILLLFWWGLSRNSIPQGSAAHADDHAGDHHTPQAHSEPHGDHHEAPEADVMRMAEVALPATAVEPTAVASTEPDDLKIIEGIGPKIEEILHDAGTKTFAELAAASVSELEKIVREDAGIRIAFPDTWPEQAKLAAQGNWSALEQLQDDLKGGRRA